MGEFRFKRFCVVNDRSAMKVNTDGVLLGALMSLSAEDGFLLDVGTGTGTIALMAAQRLSDLGCAGSVIHAIDVDEASADEAAYNFASSPWPDMLSAEHISLAGYTSGTLPEIDHIFSNPPYFDTELRSPDERRRNARHAESLSYRELVDFASVSLCENGRLSLILPAEAETDLRRYAAEKGLYMFRIVRIRTVRKKAPRRIVAEFSRRRVRETDESGIAIQENGKYTDEYISLTEPFYL